MARTVVRVVSTWYVRPASREDVAAVADVYVVAWRAAFGHLLPPARVPDPQLRSRAPGFVAAPLCLVVESAGRVVGFAAGDPGNGQLDACYVHPVAWGSGAAVALLGHADRCLAAQGVRPWLWVWDGNARARAFYARNGWTPSGAVRVADVAGVRFRYAAMLSPTPDPTA